MIDSQATGVRHQIQTNSSGVFSVPQLQPGPYTVTVSHEGFQTTKSDVTVVIDQVANLSITMRSALRSRRSRSPAQRHWLSRVRPVLGTVIEQKRRLIFR